MNKQINVVKFNGRNGKVFAGNFATKTNIFAVPSCQEV